MNILAIETSTQACSVALSVDGVITEQHQILNNQHSEFLLGFIDELISCSKLVKSDLDVIAVGNGPGSFTGLRLGMGVAQGMAYGLSIPLIPISSLLTIAAQSDHDYLLVAVDARMGEVYWQCFERLEDLKFKPLTEPGLNKPGELKLPVIDGSWFGVGSGWDQYTNELKYHLNQETDWADKVLPKASVVINQAEIRLNDGNIDLGELGLPSYVRNNVAY